MIDNHTIKFPFSDQDMQTVIFYDASNRPQYICKAHAGVATSVAQWQIRKITYDAVTGLPLTIKLSGGVNDYTSVCDDHAILTYA